MIDVTVLSVSGAARNVKSFVMTRPRGYGFVSGQYCMVSLLRPAEVRPFTFTSTPNDDYLELTVKLAGAFTKRMFAKQPGEKLYISQPHGVALSYDPDAKRTGFVAGGSGITPFISIIRHVCRSGLPGEMTLFYSNKTRQDIIFYNELMKNSRVRKVFALTEEKAAGFLHGHIGRETILHHVRDPASVAWYVCGPPKMNSSVKGILIEIGVNEADIRIEPWEVGSTK